jgi:transposase
MRMILTQGQRADCTQSSSLISGLRLRAIIADRAYDTNAMIATAKALGAELVVSSKSNRKFPRSVNKAVYRRGNIIERIIGRLKDHRRIATRFEETDTNFFGFIYIAAILYNLNPTVNTT